MDNRLQSWWQDGLLRGVLKNSSYLFSSNTVAAGLSFLQGIFATRLLGIDGYGLVSATIIVFVSNIHSLLSFRMSETVVRFTASALKEGRKDQAAALVKTAGLLEASTSVLAYLVLLLLAPLAGRYLGKDLSTTSLFTFYGLALLANLLFETSTGVLRAARRFDRIAQVNLGQSSGHLCTDCLGLLGRAWRLGSLRRIPGRQSLRRILSVNLCGTPGGAGLRQGLVACLAQARSRPARHAPFCHQYQSQWDAQPADPRQPAALPDLLTFAYGSRLLPPGARLDQPGHAAHRADHLAHLHRDHQHHRPPPVAGHQTPAAAGEHYRCLCGRSRRAAGWP